MKSFKEMLLENSQENWELTEANLDVKVQYDKKVSDAPDGRYWQQYYKNDRNDIFAKIYDGVLYFDVWRTPNHEHPRSRSQGVKVFRKSGNKWIDVNTKKDASKYLNDLFHILEREVQGDIFFK